MKTINLNESAKTPLEKMQDANAGRRRQNWAACADAKLVDYYIICLNHSLTVAAEQAVVELIKRNMEYLVAPRMYALTNFTVDVAQWLWDNRNYPNAVLHAGKDSLRNSSGTMRPSEHHLRMLILAYAMGRPELQGVIDELKKYIKTYCGTYSRHVPMYLQVVADNATLNDAISKAVQGVNYN